MPDAPQVHAADRAAWRAWLAENAAGSTGIWLVYEKGPGRRLAYDDIVEEALCFGWVDSRPRSLDDAHAMLYVAPREPQKLIAANEEGVERLTAAGSMTPTGLALVEAAKAGGPTSGVSRPDDRRRAEADRM